MYTVISKVPCPWCDKAEDLIMNKVGSVHVVDVGEEPWLRPVMLMAGLKTVPQIITTEGELIHGYEALVEHFGGGSNGND